MEQPDQLIFDTSRSFRQRALEVYEYQINHVKPYRMFVESLYGSGYKPEQLSEIPLVPVELFRETRVISDEFDEESLHFQSSGTSSMQRSNHYVARAEVYKKAINVGFEQVFGTTRPIILAYTPGYNENPRSSLIYMLNFLIQNDETRKSTFLDVQNPPDTPKLDELAATNGRPLLLFGAAFGLLDWIEKKDIRLPENAFIMETGGMKTHRREMTKSQLRTQLANGFGIPPEHIFSEYGMTEMLSQAYSMGDEWFYPSSTLKVAIRDENDPDKEVPPGEQGLIGIYDLANVHSCSFFYTRDLGFSRSDGAFKVLGRSQQSALRGCNFLLEED